MPHFADAHAVGRGFAPVSSDFVAALGHRHVGRCGNSTDRGRGWRGWAAVVGQAENRFSKARCSLQGLGVQRRAESGLYVEKKRGFFGGRCMKQAKSCGHHGKTTLADCDCCVVDAMASDRCTDYAKAEWLRQLRAQAPERADRIEAALQKLVVKPPSGRYGAGRF